MCSNIVTYVTCPELTYNASYMHYIIADFNISELICELVALVDGNVFLQINMRLLKSV